MVFYSFPFLFLFLPVVLGLYFFIATRLGRQAAVVFLVLASLAFYAAWNPVFVPILCASVVFNYLVGIALLKKQSRLLLAAGVIANLSMLVYCKYMNFFLDIVNGVAGTGWHIGQVLLPLGISFYTFQQLSWLADCHGGHADGGKGSFWRYALFVSFFPHLVAGPLVDHTEMMPQFSRDETFRPKWSSLAVGISIFIIGLIKKVILADAFGAIVTPVYTAAAQGPVPMAEAWMAAFCYAFQIYLDISGYSDMAVGLARMFNIRLPMNFNSPLKAPSIVEFWNRWHMTMTRFFKAYVHVPVSITLLRWQKKLGIKNNLGIHAATFATYLAIGAWHGANWTFVIFGILQSLALMLNHQWRVFRQRHGMSPMPEGMGIFCTYVFFTVTCVLFRSENLAVAKSMYSSMLMLEKLPQGQAHPGWIALWFAGATVCFFLPNTQQIMRQWFPVIDARNVAKLLRGSFFYKLRWRPVPLWCCALLFAYLLCLGVLMDTNRVQEFLYFQF